MKLSIGKIPGSVAAQAFAEWVSSDSDARDEWFQIFLSFVESSLQETNTLSEQKPLAQSDLVS